MDVVNSHKESLETKVLSMERMKNIDQELRTFIAQSDSPYLPSVSALARNFRCGIQIISCVLHQLAADGLVEIRQGRRTCIVGRRSPPGALPSSEPRQTESQRIMSDLLAKIEVGEIRAGERLPKYGFYIVRNGVSARTVRGIYLELASRKLVYKKGRSWIAGKDRDGAVSAIGHDLPVILIVQNALSWHRHITERNVKLFMRFTTECETHGVRLVNHQVSWGLCDSPSGSELEKLQRVITGLGGSYLGSLILVPPDLYGNFRGVARVLAQYNKPVIWLDSNGTLDIPAKPDRVIRACFSEEMVARAASTFLYRMGHRLAGYAGANDGAWQQNRRDLLMGDKHSGQGLKLLPYESALGRLRKLGRKGLAAMLHEARKAGRPHVSKTIAFLLHELRWKKGSPDSYDSLARMVFLWADVPMGSVGEKWTLGAVCGVCLDANAPKNVLSGIERLLPHLLCEDVTAVIVPHDKMVASTLSVLERIGISVPGDLSLISFDNYLRHSTLPVTTIDFGGDNLGYRVFHAFLGDVPYGPGKVHAMVARPHVVHRGSVKRLR